MGGSSPSSVPPGTPAFDSNFPVGVSGWLPDGKPSAGIGGGKIRLATLGAPRAASRILQPHPIQINLNRVRSAHITAARVHACHWA
jgi:hypothetical protein